MFACFWPVPAAELGLLSLSIETSYRFEGPDFLIWPILFELRVGFYCRQTGRADLSSNNTLVNWEAVQECKIDPDLTELK